MVPIIRKRTVAIGLIIFALLAAPSASARQRKWYRDWKFWAGEGVIAAALVLDGRSTCDGFKYGFVEANAFSRGTRSCPRIARQLIIAGAVYTTVNLLEHKYVVEPGHRYWNFAAYVETPVIVGVGHGYAADRNFRLIHEAKAHGQITGLAGGLFPSDIRH